MGSHRIAASRAKTTSGSSAGQPSRRCNVAARTAGVSSASSHGIGSPLRWSAQLTLDHSKVSSRFQLPAPIHCHLPLAWRQVSLVPDLSTKRCTDPGQPRRNALVVNDVTKIPEVNTELEREQSCRCSRSGCCEHRNQLHCQNLHHQNAIVIRSNSNERHRRTANWTLKDALSQVIDVLPTTIRGCYRTPNPPQSRSSVRIS